MELRLEVDATGGVSVEVELNPLFSGALLGEELKGNFSLGDVVSLVSMCVVDMDLHVVVNEASVNLHVLTVPDWVLAAVFANSRSPFFVTDLDVDKWVHLVEETALVVFEMSGLEVKMDVAVTGVGENYDDWH